MTEAEILAIEERLSAATYKCTANSTLDSINYNEAMNLLVKNIHSDLRALLDERKRLLEIVELMREALEKSTGTYSDPMRERDRAMMVRDALKEERAKHRCEYCDNKPSGLEKESREVDCRGCGRVTGFEGTQCSNCGVTL